MNRLKKLAILTAISAVLLSAFAFTTGGDKYFAIARNLDIFATLFKEVNGYYVDEINPNELIERGINGMLASLDPYTNYIPEDDIEDYRTMTTGQYGGIGALIGRNSGQNIIVMPYEDFPADKSGLKIGDAILRIDGIDVKDKTTSEISKLLKGQAGTDLELLIKRFNQEDPMTITLTREKITINNVPYYGMIAENTGYVKLTDFTTGAGKEVKDAVIELKADGADKIILDLRGNPGGLLNEAINISNIFIPKNSEVVSTIGKVTEWNQTYSAKQNPVDTDIPLVVLTNNMSASASEIVAGVMQDYDRGVLVGSKTFGKGLVQATRNLTYNSQLKITTAKYYTPSGRCIQAIDYSNRNEDGSVGKIPDSLKTAFKTENGRIVYDGGGIDPDIEVDQDSYAPITVSLITKGHIFDYATRYYYNNLEKEIDPLSFSLNDAEYDDFRTWIQDKDYDYTTKVERTIEELIASAKKEKYFERVEGQINDLKAKVQHNKEEDLMVFREEIIETLEEEIISRYYLQEGMIEASFDDDPVVQKAIEVLNDADLYQETLGKI